MFWPFIEIDNELSYCPLADFGALHVREGKDIYAKAVVAQPLTGHIKLFNAAQAMGKIVLMERGKCDFVTKVLHAQEAGAIAVLVANSETDDPKSAFVMDAGSRRNDVSAIQIPAMMLSSSKASVVFDQIRRCYLDRRELALTVKFLGTQAAALVLEDIEHAVKQKRQHELEEKRKEDMEKQQMEASKQLRSRLGKAPSSTVSTPLSTPRATPKRSKSPSSDGSIARSQVSCVESVCGSIARSQASDIESTYETSSVGSSSSNSSNSSTGSCYFDNQVTTRKGSVTNHWCPMTTALLIMDVQNYFALHQNEKCLEPHSHVNLDYYKRINSIMVPTIQDVLLASRSSEGMEVVYSIVESATQDGRDRSRAHKHAGIHIAKSGFGAKILTRIAPAENDIVVPRTGIKYATMSINLCCISLPPDRTE